MAAQYCYRILFFLQSAAFIVFIIYYYQQSAVIQMPIKMSDNGKCVENGIRESLVRENGRPLSNCTLADIKKRPGVMVLTTTNAAYMDVTLNMLESMKRAGVCVNTTVIAENRNVYQYLRKRAEGDPAVHVSLTNSGEMHSNEPSRRDRSKYYGLMNKRQAYILAMLEQGLEVLFTDSDTFWFRDPFPYFKGDFDMSAIDPRSPYPTRTSKAHYCAGFVYYKPTNVTLQFVKAWIQAMKGRTTADQNVMNNLLHDDKPVHVNMQPLDTNLFPWGPKFYELLAKKANYSTVVMHAASIRGHPAKVAKFTSSDMWFMNSTNEEMLESVDAKTEITTNVNNSRNVSLNETAQNSTHTQ